MDRDTWLKHYDEAPAAVQDYLLDPASGEHEAAAQEALAYDNDAWDRVMDVVWDAVFGGLTQEAFRDRIKKLAGDRKAEDVERDVLLHVVLPLADLVDWDVDERLVRLGVPVDKVQGSVRVSLRPVSYGAAVRRIASQAKISLLTGEVVRRVRDLLVSYIKGVRTRTQILEMLQRTQQEGGVGMTKEQGEAFLDAMAEFLSATTVMSEQEYADWYANQRNVERSREIDASRNAQRATPGGDDEEVRQTKATMPKAPATALEAAVESVVAAAGLQHMDEYLSQRLRSTVSTRLREVRNAAQTRALLERDTKVGGMGLGKEDADRIASLIEKAFAEQHEGILTEERQSIEQTKIVQQKKVEERKKRESEEHAEWYRKKVEGARAEASVNRSVSGGQPTSTKLRPTSSSVDGIASPPVLSDLISELGGMTVAEFRRMGKGPTQSAERVRQKLETLKAESFDRWTDGVQAWRSSPVQQAYLKLVAESFSNGTPVAELAAKKQAADPNALSAEELGAIIDLNRDIQL